MTLRTLYTLCTPHSTLYTLHFAVRTLYTLHFTLDTWHLTLHTLHFTLHTLNFTLDTTLHFTLPTLHTTLYTPHSTLDTPHSTLYTLRFTLHALHFIFIHCTLYAPHSTLYSPHTLHFTLSHFTPYTSLFTLCTPHSTHCTLHFALRTLHFTLHTLHFTHSQLYTFHTWPCMEPWPSFIFMLRTHTYLSSLTSALHCVTSSRASKGPPRCRRWTFESSPITGHHVGYAEWHSALYTLLFYTLHSKLYTLHSTHYTLHVTLRTLYTLYAPHSTLHSTDDTAHSIYNLHSTHYTLHSTSLYALLYTSHLTLDTPLYTLHSTLWTLHLTLYTTFYTPHSTLHTLNSTHYTWHPHSTHYTLHSTLHTLHFTLYTAHCTLYSPHSTLYTLHFHLTPSQLYTFHTLRSMEPWPSFIFMLRTHTYLSSSTSALHCITSSRASKGPLRCRRWTFESFPITSHHVGYAEFPFLLRATVHHRHMFSFSPLSKYIASICRFGCSPYQHAPASDPLAHVDKSCTAALCPLCFHAKLPAKLAFVPGPWASSHAIVVLRPWKWSSCYSVPHLPQTTLPWNQRRFFCARWWQMMVGEIPSRFLQYWSAGASWTHCAGSIGFSRCLPRSIYQIQSNHNRWIQTQVLSAIL